MAELRQQDKTEIDFDDGYLLISQIDSGSGKEVVIAIYSEMAGRFIELVKEVSSNLG